MLPLQAESTTASCVRTEYAEQAGDSTATTARNRRAGRRTSVSYAERRSRHFATAVSPLPSSFYANPSRALQKAHATVLSRTRIRSALSSEGMDREARQF